MSVESRIEELRKKYPEYAHMRYKTESGKFSGDNWLKASFGQGFNGQNWFLTTDRIHYSEDSGDAETDSNLIAELLNIFCNER